MSRKPNTENSETSRQIAGLHAQGKTDGEIAQALHISVAWASSHRRALGLTTNVRCRWESCPNVIWRGDGAKSRTNRSRFCKEHLLKWDGASFSLFQGARATGIQLIKLAKKDRALAKKFLDEFAKEDPETAKRLQWTKKYIEDTPSYRKE